MCRNLFADEEAIETLDREVLTGIVLDRRNLFADEEAIETRCPVSVSGGKNRAGTYSLTKKRLRQVGAEAYAVRPLRRNLFADEEAIETYLPS